MKVIYSDIKKEPKTVSTTNFTSCPLILLKLTKFLVFENPKKGAEKTEKGLV